MDSFRSVVKSNLVNFLGALTLLAAPVSAHVTLISPNGGEVLSPGSTFSISWRINIKHNQQNWDLWYSATSNNGPWTNLATNLPPGSFSVGSVHTYDWTVPAAPASQVWVRVRMDNSGQDYYDVSNGPFAIGEVAAATAFNGTGINRSCFTVSSLPLVGGSVVLDVDHSTHPGATFTYVLGYAASATGPIVRAGEVLVDLTSAYYFTSIRTSSGTSDTHSLLIPNDPSLSGFQASAQAVILGGGVELCNALELTIGF